MDLSVSIVNCNTKEHLHRCLKSLFANKSKLDLEVTVVDNGSRDGSAEMLKDEFPQVRLIVNQENVFFTKAHNQAFAIAQGRYVLSLNPDTIVRKGTLVELVRYLDSHAQAGAVSCREVNIEDQTQFTASSFRTPLIEIIEWTVLRNFSRLRACLYNFRLSDWDRKSSRPVDVISGCFLMVRNDLLKKLEGYDDCLLHYFGEDDLCLRIWRSGYQVMFISSERYIHYGQQASKKENQRTIREIYFQDMLTYYRKHFGRFQTGLMWIMIQSFQRVGLGYRLHV